MLYALVVELSCRVVVSHVDLVVAGTKTVLGGGVCSSFANAFLQPAPLVNRCLVVKGDAAFARVVVLLVVVKAGAVLRVFASAEQKLSPQAELDVPVDYSGDDVDVRWRQWRERWQHEAWFTLVVSRGWCWWAVKGAWAVSSTSCGLELLASYAERSFGQGGREDNRGLGARDRCGQRRGNWVGERKEIEDGEEVEVGENSGGGKGIGREGRAYAGGWWRGTRRAGKRCRG